jgi:hypothetical protein
MRTVGFLLAFLVACGGPRTIAPQAPMSEVESEVESDVESEVESEVESIAAPEAVSPPEVAVRLAALDPSPVPWTTQLADVSPSDITALCAYDAAHPQTPITEQCSGASVVVGRADACGWRIEDTRTLGTRCDLTVGDVVACRLALADHPCARMGAGLPECARVAGCIERHHHESDPLLLFQERFGSRIRF